MTGAARERSAGTLAPMLALLAVAILIAPIGPFPLLAIPFALLLVAFRPRDLFGVVVAAVLMLLVFRSVDGEADGGWLMVRGWCLIAGGLFIGLSARRTPVRLLDRSFASVGCAMALVVVAALASPDLGASMDGWMAERIRAAATMAHALLLADPQVSSGTMGDSIGAAIEQWASFQRDVYPALLALATMAALALCWYFAGRRDGVDRPPPVRDFGFRDGYVWLLVAGLALLVLPLGAGAFRLGENATLFMSLMFLARGGAILLWILTAASTSVWTWVLLGIGMILAYPFVAGAALLIGIGDTWLHVREKLRDRAASGPGSY
ncbi:MAG: hypothetical protein M8841_09375 [marine benthic group bacterium]|nr:hypothetical protein [Gemmatimonadota bacterium]MCL7978037.1 hypothetical protein [Gemmatimonadota bacterium]